MIPSRTQASIHDAEDSVVSLLQVRGQEAAPRTGSDLTAVCEAMGEAFGKAELVFTGRAQPPVTVRISGEAEIEQARQNLVQVEAEVERLRASLDAQTRMEREREFAIRVIDANAALVHLQAYYPPPENLTLIPVHVEQQFRGEIPPRLMLRRTPPDLRTEPGTLYLIAGVRVREDITSIDMVDVWHAIDAESAARELRFLSSNSSGGTVLGRLEMQSHGDGGRRTPLGAVRIRVSSGAQVVETMTSEDGSFTVSGIQAGHLEMRPFLHEDLTVINTLDLKMEIREGGCNTVHLKAELNGRVRGRIVSASGTSLDGVELLLQGLDSSGRMSGSHQPSTSVRPSEDGTFEFSGQVPDSYVLSAGLERVENGKRRRLITYFPGTPDRSAAVPVVIGKATQHSGFDFLVITE